MKKSMLLCLVSSLVASASSAFAVTPYDSIVTAADISGLSTTATTLLAVAIVIPVVFAGYKLIKRSIKSV